MIPNLEGIGRWIFIVGVAVAVTGGIIWLLGRNTGLQNLPGTIKISLPGATCLIPVLGMILISVVLTILLNILLRIINR